MRNIIQGVCVFLFSFLVGVDDDSFNKSDRREFVDKPKRVLLSWAERNVKDENAVGSRQLKRHCWHNILYHVKCKWKLQSV